MSLSSQRMNSVVATRWRFSLRAILILMVVVAGVATAAVTLEKDLLFGVLFGVGSVAAAALLRGAVRRSYLVSLAAIYGPFVAMATYTYFYVACSHCKETTWIVLPYAPGIVPTGMAAHYVKALKFDQPISNWVSLACAVILVAGLTWLASRRAWWVRALSVVAAAAVSSGMAFIVLALIQA